MPKNSKGFTLIELLVVVGIVVILGAGLIIMINPAAKLNDAKTKTAKYDLSHMSRLIQSARLEQFKILKDVTGSYCTGCSCYCEDLRSPSAACFNVMNNAWIKITGKTIPKDPWGNIYVMDENEFEGGSCATGKDWLKSGGPDNKMHSGSCPSTDDIREDIPHFNCP